MPRLLNRPPKLRRHATGQGVVTLSGRDHYCGRYGTSECRERHRRLVKEWFASGCTITPQVRAEPLVVKQLIAGYWRHAKAYYRLPDGRPTSTLHIVKSVLRSLRRTYGGLPAADFGPRRLKSLRDEWINAGCTRSTCNGYTGSIVRCFRWAAENELIPGDCYHALRSISGLRAGRSGAVETVGVSIADPLIIKRVLRQVSPTLSAMIRFQWRTGCRPQEVCDLHLGRVDRTRPVWEYRPQHHETLHHGHSRVILIGPKAQRILNNFITTMGIEDDGFLFNPARAEDKRRATRHAQRVTPLCCGNRPGSNRKTRRQRPPRDQYSPASYCRAIKRACIKAGVSPFSPNQLRHNAATRIRQRAGLEAAQVILGHRHARITEVYAERNTGLGRQIAHEIG